MVIQVEIDLEIKRRVVEAKSVPTMYVPHALRVLSRFESFTEAITAVCAPAIEVSSIGISSAEVWCIPEAEEVEILICVVAELNKGPS